MPFTTADWHKRYQQQADWSKTIRDHIIRNLNLPASPSLLEVGCGTSAVLSNYSKNPAYLTFGLDIDSSALHFNQNKDPRTILTCGNALGLPFADASFDLAFCHYLLLWLKDPLSAIKEMKRVTRPGSCVCAFAEPDYQGRIACPDELAKVADLQTQSLIQQGVNPSIGRQLRHLFAQAGLIKVKAGILAAEWNDNTISLESEMEIINNDLTSLEGVDASIKKINLNQIHQDSIYFIPTFYAFGQVE